MTICQILTFQEYASICEFSWTHEQYSRPKIIIAKYYYDDRYYGKTLKFGDKSRATWYNGVCGPISKFSRDN